MMIWDKDNVDGCFKTARSHLVADDVDLVLHLGNPLTHDGEQLRDGGPRVHEDLQTGRVVGVEEGEGWRRRIEIRTVRLISKRETEKGRS